MREFPLGEILTVTTGKLVARRMMDGVYDILNSMTGANLYTHQLPAAAEECRPFLLEQYPQLGNIDDAVINKENVWEWLGEQEKIYGDKLPIKPIGK